MKPSQLASLLEHAIPAGLPILIKGAPGIGKTSIVEQAAAKLGAKVILSHPAVSDPTDAKGLPWVSKDGDSATFLPFGELAEALRATDLTIWFLDDLGQAPPAVQASFMQLLLARRVNGHKLPDCVTFVAATNRRTDRAGVTGILEPVKSRFAAIVELDADLNEWCQWAIRENLPPELIAFLRFRPDLLLDFQPSADLTQSPSPRTWAFAAKLLRLNMPESVEHEALAGAVGEGPATEFIAFLKMARQMPNIDAILVDPNKGDIPAEPAVLYAVVTGLAAKVTLANFARIARYAERLAEASYGEFAALLIRDCMERELGITQTSAFAELASGELGALIAGEV